MNPFFGEFVPDGNFLLQFFGTLGFISGIIATWITISGRNKSQKREVAFETVYATKEELAQMKEFTEGQVRELKDSLCDLKREIKEDHTSLMTRLDQKIEGVHSRVTELVSKVGEIVGELKSRP